MNMKFSNCLVVYLLSTSIMVLSSGLVDEESGEIIYIKPTSASTEVGISCPSEPCLTLAQFAENTRREPKDVATLIYLPGNHTLDTIISVANIRNMSMVINVSHQLPVKIICHLNASFNLNAIDFFLIRGLIFVGCGGNQIISVKKLMVENSVFVGASETALEIVRTNSEITNCSFVNNKFGSYYGPIQIPQFWNADVYAFIGGAIVANQSNITIVESKFEGNAAEIGGAIFATQGSNVTITKGTFQENQATCMMKPGSCLGAVGNDYFENGFYRVASQMRTLFRIRLCTNSTPFGGVVGAFNSSVSLTLSTFFNNSASTFGGVVFAQSGSDVKVRSSEFAANRAQICGGVIFAWSSSRVNIQGGSFHHNDADVLISNCDGDDHKIVQQGGGVIFISHNSSVLLNASIYYSNVARGGAVLNVVLLSAATIIGCTFHNNSATFGGVIDMLNANLNISKSTFFNNTVDLQGGVLNSEQKSNVTIQDSQFKYNTANRSGGALILSYSGHVILINSQFIGNEATHGGALHVTKITQVTLYNIEFKENRALSEGGVLESIQSDITFRGNCSLTGNTAKSGGAIYTSETQLNMFDRTVIMFNTANDTGGGAYLYRSKLTCQYQSILSFVENGANGKGGGGIFASNSFVELFCHRDVKLQSSIHFTKNNAVRGGGVLLESSAGIQVQKNDFDIESKVNINRTISLNFTKNSADYGGAIYVDDATNYGMCTGSTDAIASSTCFLQVLSPFESYHRYNVTSIGFSQNHASKSGATLYGGLLDRCPVDSRAELLIVVRSPTASYNDRSVDAVTYFENISDTFDISTVSSGPLRVCFCNSDGRPDCSYSEWFVKVKKGEKFTIPVVAVDQVNHTMMNVSVRSDLQYTESGFGEGQMLQTTSDNCTDLTFSIYSTRFSEVVTMYAEGPCGNASKSQAVVSVTFLNCSCPPGFQPNYSEKTNCSCECDSKLPSYVTECNAGNGTLLRDSNYWITYLNNSGYLSYPHCPFDYCTPVKSKLEISLKDADAQCANHRSGTLCGVCQPDHSLSIGNSHCVHCSKSWPVVCAAIIIAGFLAGIVLVAFLMMLNLTVAVGTFNGLIFFVNVIDANNSIFFKSDPVARYLSLPISWLSLDLGIGTCFIKGMDTYWKTWLQLVFPTYIILLVVTMIVVSEHSIRFSRLIAKRNPVATLATLVLLSYTKLLRTIIVCLSFATLVYPDGSRELVWLPDATVRYLSGKHIALFAVAVIILIVGIAYTLLLFSWQWLLYHQNKKVFEWVTRNQRLCYFFEPYHAPYTIKHRYWTGLLLFARVCLYLVFTLNVSGDPGINLLAMVVMGSCLLFCKGVIGHLYKNWLTDVIESINYLNIVFFSGAGLFVLESGRNQIVIANTSVVIFLVLLLFALAYHLFTEVCSKSCQNMRRRSANESNEDVDHPNYNPPKHVHLCSASEPTVTVISKPSHREKALLGASEAGMDSDDFQGDSNDEEDVLSTVSEDSTTPLLVELKFTQ